MKNNAPETCPKCGAKSTYTTGSENPTVGYECLSTFASGAWAPWHHNPQCELRKLRARVAELETLDRKWGETYTTQTAALAAKDRRIAELEAALAASVPREHEISRITKESAT